MYIHGYNRYDEEKGVVIAERLQPMARMGGNSYSTVGGMFDIARPDV